LERQKSKDADQKDPFEAMEERSIPNISNTNDPFDSFSSPM
jgi:hypothetical protein